MEERMKPYWGTDPSGRKDRSTKWFDQAVRPTEDGYETIPVTSLRPGEPACLRLANGDVIRTSEVRSVEPYRIRTKSRTYLKNLY